MTLEQSTKFLLARQERLTDLFYTKFLDRHPDLQPFFKNVDLDSQAVMLKMAIVIVAEYYQHRYPGAEEYLIILGKRHCKWQIPLNRYPEFVACLMETLEQCHGYDWNDQLHDDWQSAIDMAVEVMSRGYE